MRRIFKMQQILDRKETEIKIDVAQMLGLAIEDFKEAIVTLVTEAKQNIFTMMEKTESIGREKETIK